MIRRCLGLLIAVAGCCFPQADQQPCAVQGKVVNSITGEALRNAAVSLHRPSSGLNIVRTVVVAGVQNIESTAPPAVHTTSTGDQGGFCIPAVPPGSYYLRAGRTGFLDHEYDARGRVRPAPAVTVAAGQIIPAQVVRLTPQSVITGRVFDEEGHPVAKATVKLLGTGYLHGERQLLIRKSADTDNRGEYRMGGIAPGQYFAVALPPVRRSDSGTVVAPPGSRPAVLMPAYYTGVADPASAGKIDLPPGAERSGLDIPLGSGPAFRIKGTALDAAGQPIAGARISAALPVAHWRAGHDPCLTAADGAFELSEVPAGVYILQAYKSPQGTVSRQTLEVSGDLEGLVVKSVTARTLTGSVVLKGGAKAALNTIRILLESAAGYGSIFGEVKQDGAFILAGVKSDRYRFSAAALPDDLYIASVSGPGGQFGGMDLDFTSGVPARLDIVLAAGSGRIHGAVSHKGAPVAGALLALFPADYLQKPRWSRRVVRSNQRGEYAIAGVAPGEYTLLAWEDAETGEVEDPEFMKRYEGRAVNVSIEASASVEINPPLIPKEP